MRIVERMTYLMAKIHLKDTVVRAPPIAGPAEKPGVYKMIMNVDSQLLLFKEAESDNKIRTTCRRDSK